MINHVSKMTDTFEKILYKINGINEATDEKICREEERSAAQDMIEMGPFGYLDSACTSGVGIEEDQKHLVDTGEISTNVPPGRHSQSNQENGVGS